MIGTTWTVLLCAALAAADGGAAKAAVKKSTDAGTPAKAVKKPADAGTPARAADAGMPAKAMDAGVPAKAVDAGAPAKAVDAGASAKAVDAGTPAKAADGSAPRTVDAGVAKAPEPEKKVDAKPPAGGAKYTLVKVAEPDKKIERVWKSKCGSCHGTDGKAATEKGKKMLVDDMTVAGWQTGRTNDEIKKVIAEGTKREKNGVKQEMDPFKEELSPEQLDGLVQFVRWLGAPK